MPRPDFKHRDAVYQTLCAQIVREATDLQSLAASAARALGHPDVSSDPMLGAVLRGFIAEREAYLRQARVLAPPEQAPDKPAYVEITFEKGIPVALDGKKLPGIDLITQINKLAGSHGVGRTESVENRLVGIKSREVYESPAGWTIYTAHRALEALTLSRDVLHFKQPLSDRYAELVYTGLWFSDLREALDAFFNQVNSVVTGTVRLKLYKGSCAVVGRKSPNSLYDTKLATYTPEDAFDHKSSTGFIHIWTLPVRAEARRRESREK